jgi:hypothetical protein
VTSNNSTSSIYVQAVGQQLPATAIFETAGPNYYFSPNTYFAQDWAETMSFVEFPSYCGTSMGVHIPVLLVDSLYGFTAVNSLSTSAALTTNGVTNGYVSLGLASPAASNNAQSGVITGSEIALTPTNFLAGNPVQTGGAAGYRAIIWGHFSSTTVGTTTITVRYGTNTFTANGIMAQAIIPSAGTGSSVTFKMEIDLAVLYNSGTYTSYLSMAGVITNPSSTGITSVPTYLIAPTTTSAALNGTTYNTLVITGTTSNANNQLVIDQATIEAIV